MDVAQYNQKQNQSLTSPKVQVACAASTKPEGLSLFTPKTGAELQALKERRLAMYQQIKEVILPVSWTCRVFIGGCIERGVGSSFRAQAHAHCWTSDKYFGWICLRSIKRIGQYHTLANNDGSITLVVDKPSMLLIHEYAHILAPNHHHDDIWRKKVKELGGRIHKQYKKKRKQ